MKYIITILLLISSLISHNQSNRRYLLETQIRTLIPQGYTPVFVTSGQSNMQGVNVDELPAEYTSVSSNIKILGNVRRLAGDTIAFSDTFEAIDYNAKKWGTNHSSTLPLAHLWGNKKAYFIKVARGSTSLSSYWVPTGACYIDLVNALNYALAQIAEQNLYFIFIWSQYESETVAYTSYVSNINSMFDGIQSETGVIFDQKLWYQVNTSDNVYLTRQAQYDYIDSLQQNTDIFDYIIPVRDLTLGDDVHFNSASQITIAQRIYNYISQ